MDIPKKIKGVKGEKYWIFIASVAALITVVHFLLFARYSPLVVLEELYYIPLLLGALWFGIRGAIVTYVLVSLLYLPFFFVGDWTVSALGVADRALHLVFSGIFTFTAAFFVDRERKRRQQVEREKYLAGIGQAATTIVHDLKNPLIAILGFGRRIQERKGDIDAAATVIMDSARSMERIVNDVLDFARPVRLELKEEDARAIIKRVYDVCATQAGEKGVLLSLDLPADPMTLVVDGVQMQRALINLVNNAIEASSAGQPVALLAARGQKGLVIRIRDYGPGMDNEGLEKLFTPFFTTKISARKGTGLGLYVIRKIITENHKGTIVFESDHKVGTRFILGLPIAR